MLAVEMPWRKLVESIKRGNCILILGPQVSFDPDHPDRLPLATLLARRLADHTVLKDAKDLINRDDLAHVAQLFTQLSDRYELEIAVEDFYNAYQKVTTDFHRDLAALPFTLCINAAPDNLFSNAFALIEKPKILCRIIIILSILGLRFLFSSIPLSLIFIICMVTAVM